VALVWRFNFVCDDAFISYRYARNLADGLGLRYNLGVAPPVEGYSNFLWVLWCALFEAIGVEVTAAARVTSIACGILTLWWVMRFAERRLGLPPLLAALPALFLATLPPFSVWSMGGLETLPFTFALFAIFDRLLVEASGPRWGQAAVFGVLASLLRADGALLVGMALGAALLSAVRPRNSALGRAALAAGAVVGAAVAAHVAFRLAYHGDLLPNTAYAKVGLSSFSIEQGRNYLAAMALTFPALLLVPAVALASMGVRGRADRLSLELLALPLGIAAYVVLVAGGDFMSMARLLVPALPYLALLAALPLRFLPARPPRERVLRLAWPALLVAISLPPAFDVSLVPDSWRHPFRFRASRELSEYQFWKMQRDRTLQWKRTAAALNRFTQPGESLVVLPAGVLGYETQLFIYDRHGLVTREVARRPLYEWQLRKVWRPSGHHKRVPMEFFLSERPTYLEAQLLAGRLDEFEAPGLSGYRAVYHPLPPELRHPGELFLYLLQRVSIAEEIGR
jgi:hypothetical protein